MDYEEIMLMRTNRAKKDSQAAIREHVERRNTISEETDRNAIWNKIASLGSDDYDYIDFKKKVTDAFLVEGLTILVDNCVDPILIKEEYNQKLVRQLVSAFVNENGSANLLNKMKKTSYLMSEMAYITECTIQSVLEKADKNNTETFKIEQKDKDEFYNKLSKVDVDESIDKITSRVKGQVNEFVTNNMEEKAQLGEALKKTEKKVADTKEKLKEKANDEKAKDQAQKIEEGYIELGKRRAVDIRENRTKNVFEHMVYNLAKTAMLNESAGQVFIKDSRLDMDKIVEHCEVLCTFITTLDSTKLINLDESYIDQMLRDMKN